jgi:hypothetical protein
LANKVSTGNKPAITSFIFIILPVNCFNYNYFLSYVLLAAPKIAWPIVPKNRLQYRGSYLLFVVCEYNAVFWRQYNACCEHVAIIGIVEFLFYFKHAYRYGFGCAVRRIH